mgnify:CR=1 FL=1
MNNNLPLGKSVGQGNRALRCCVITVTAEFRTGRGDPKWKRENLGAGIAIWALVLLRSSTELYKNVRDLYHVCVFFRNRSGVL